MQEDLRCTVPSGW